MTERTDYIIRLRPRAGVDGPAALQAALKALGRRHGLQAVEVRPVVPDAADASERPAQESEAAASIAERQAVLALLEDEEWGKWSNNHIAKACGVSLDLVNRMRSSLNESLSEPRTYTTKHGTTATMNPTDTTTPSIEQRKRELTERWRGVCQRLDLHTSSSDRAAAIEELRAVEAAAMRLILAEASSGPVERLEGEPEPAWIEGQTAPPVGQTGGPGTEAATGAVVANTAPRD